MIYELHIFTEENYVYAEEWNANFKAINDSNINCASAITDAYNQLAFTDGDLTQLFNVIKSDVNSFQIAGTSIIPQPSCEYYKNIPSSQDLFINVPVGLNSDFRILVKTNEDRDLLPVIISYAGTGGIIWTGGGYSQMYYAGMKLLLCYEINNTLYIKCLRTGDDE